jgi:hypothetical protein
MREASAGGASRRAALGPADWLSLAASPTFAAMALFTGIPGADPLKTLCAGPGASLLGGMAPMYLLMSAFHSTPWLGLIGRRGIRRTAA